MAELRETIRITEAELADIEKEIVHLKHEYEAAQKELAQCRHEISVIDVEVYWFFWAYSIRISGTLFFV
jgi:predicted  nucleic acid-binding Zn-ribbon protein